MWRVKQFSKKFSCCPCDELTDAVCTGHGTDSYWSLRLIRGFTGNYGLLRLQNDCSVIALHYCCARRKVVKWSFAFGCVWIVQCVILHVQHSACVTCTFSEVCFMHVQWSMFHARSVKYVSCTILREHGYTRPDMDHNAWHRVLSWFTLKSISAPIFIYFLWVVVEFDWLIFKFTQSNKLLELSLQSICVVNLDVGSTERSCIYIDNVIVHSGRSRISRRTTNPGVGDTNLLSGHIFCRKLHENERNYRPHQDRLCLWRKLPAAQPASGSLDLKWSVHICGRLGILRLTTSQFVFTQCIHHVRRPCMKFYFLFSQTRLAGVFYRSYLVKAVASPSTVRRTHAHRPVCVRT